MNMLDAVAESSRFQEAQVDLCVATLAQISPSVARHLWEAVGEDPPERTMVWLQEMRVSDGRPSDVLLVADDGRRIHVENKVRGGTFGPKQLDGYAKERARPATWTVLIAPEAFISGSAAGSERGSKAFDTMIPVTDLAGRAEADARTAGVMPALLRQWSAWLRELDSQLGHQWSPHESSEWVQQYREWIVTESAGEVALTPGTMRSGAATFADFAVDRPGPAPYRLRHELGFGELDLAVPGWVQSTLQAYLADAEPSLPDGWSVATQRDARPMKLTDEPTPILRYQLEPIPFPFPPFEDCQATFSVLVDHARPTRAALTRPSCSAA